jgi:hypothetical protein
MPTRIYAVQLKSKTVLAEATSQEAAVRKATATMVKKVWIPTPLETLRLQQDGATLLTESIVTSSQEPSGAADESQNETEE